MRCEKCGSEITTKRCWNCGHINAGGTFAEDEAAVTQQPWTAPAKDGVFGEDTLTQKNGRGAIVKFGDWVKLDCIQFLSLIPFIGGIATLVIQIVLMCSEKTALSMRERLKANLIWAAISIGISVILVIIVVVVGGSFLSALGKAYS